jgi:hypothetical protein
VYSALSRLSIVIPVGPGETAHVALLEQLAALPTGAEIHLAACLDEAVDVPVDLRDALRHLRVEVGHWPRGRARQLNHGVRDWIASSPRKTSDWATSISPSAMTVPGSHV